MLDHADQDNSHDGNALRNADYASLTRRAVTDNSRALVDEVLRQITDAETRKRQRGVSRADAFRQAAEGFLGDLLAARGQGWVYRPTGRSCFTDDVVSYRDFNGVRRGLHKLGLLKEVPGAQGFGTPATRFKATPLLEQLAAQHGIPPSEADRHFVLPLPKHPLLRKSTSTWTWGRKIDGKVMEIAYTDKVTALERTIVDLNKFIDGFDIRGGTHRGYWRQFECGDHPKFEWNLGGRLYSQGTYNYQQIGGDERRKMTIDGKPVCELDVRASILTIFQSLSGEPLDFINNPDLDPYGLPGLPRDVVKAFITATFGNGQFPIRWSQTVAEECKKHRIRQVRGAVAMAYPLLEALQRDDGKPPIWARLMYLESEAVLGTMLALRAVGIPALSVHDSLIVPRDNEQMARDTLSELYKTTTGATPRICNPDTAELP